MALTPRNYSNPMAIKPKLTCKPLSMAALAANCQAKCPITATLAPATTKMALMSELKWCDSASPLIVHTTPMASISHWNLPISTSNSSKKHIVNNKIAPIHSLLLSVAVQQKKRVRTETTEKPMKYYAGIGSRETPLAICQAMTMIAMEHSGAGY